MAKFSKKLKLGLICTALFALTAGGGIYFTSQNEAQVAYAMEASNSGNVTFVEGASIRADEQAGGVTGIRFKATIKKSVYEGLLDESKTSYKSGCEAGMIIVPAKIFDKWNAQKESGTADILAYIKDGLGATGNVSVVIPPEKAKINAEGTGYVLVGVVNMMEANYLYDYQATVYYKTAEGYSYEAYSDARSLAYVANAALNDTTEEAPSDAQKTVLAEKTAKTVDKRFEKEGKTVSGHTVSFTTKAVPIDLSAYFTDVTASDKTFTVTSGANIATVSASGVLTPTSNGDVTVKVSAYGGKFNYTVNVTVGGVESINVIDIAMAQWPDANNIEVTESSDIPEGYTKAYSFTEGRQWGYRRNLANVDISGYTKVSFKIKALDLQNPAHFHLWQGDTFLKNFYYADTSWHEIVLTKNAEGVWTMTADGTAVDGFTSTATNLKDTFNLSLGNTQESAGASHFVVSNIMGVPYKYTVTPPETFGITFDGADSVIAGDTYTFSIDFKGDFVAGPNFEVYAMCGGEKVVVTKNEGTGKYEFVANGNSEIYVDGVGTSKTVSVIDIAMAQWPDANSIKVTESSDIPEGYTKAYSFTEGRQWGYRRNLANVDISGYTKVSFKIKATDLQEGGLFHLYQGDTLLKNFYYADTSWHEIVLTKNAEGVWTMTADGTAVDGFTSTATNLKDTFNLSLGNTTEGCPDSHFFVTNIISTVFTPAKAPTIKKGYKEIIDIAMAQLPDDNSVGVTESDDIPEGYTKAYAFTMGWNWGYRRNLANVDISGYSTVSFMIRATDLQEGGLFHLYQGDTYLKNFYYADTSWHEIVLTNNNGTWTMTADGAEVEGFTSTATNLKDMFNVSLGNTTESQGESHFYVTNIIGVKLLP